MNRSDFDPEHQNQSTDSRIIASLERIAQAFRVLLWRESKEFSLTPIQTQLLIFLLHHPGDKRKVSYLAEEFNMTKATISETIKTLEHKKLVTKISQANDTRSYIIDLTRKGKAIAKEISFFTGEIHTPLGKLAPQDKEKLLLSLIQIIQHLNKTGIITIQRMCLTCLYYQSSETGKQHFCKLLNQPLHNTELRLDCPEYEAEATELV